MTEIPLRETPTNTVLASLIKHVLNCGVILGLDRGNLMRESGFTERELTDPDQHLALSQLEKMVNYADRELDDPLLPIKALRHIGLNAVGVVGHLMQHGANLKHAIDLQQRYQRLIGNVGIISLRPAPGIVYWCWECQSDDAGFKRLSTEFTLGLWALLTCPLRVGTQSALLGVHFAHSAPKQPDLIEQYERHFGCPVYFGQKESGLLLLPAALRIPLSSANAGLQDTLEQYARNQLELRQPPTSNLSDKVRARLRVSLRQGVASKEVVASELNISVRTLSRHLKLEGCTYRELLDELRLELARSYLMELDEPIEEIAIKLGFHNSPAFISWFRQLVGYTPGEYQRRY